MRSAGLVAWLWQWGKNCNSQNTVGKYFRVLDSKDIDFCGIDPKEFEESPCMTPEKFFCLSSFNLQVELDVHASPQKYEEVPEFLFVVFSKFLARNASSVLHSVIF